MRRVSSIAMFLIAGLLVGVQVMIAFLAGTLGDLGSLAYFTAVTVPFLAIGAWLSPGHRSREVAITMLAGATVCVASFSVALFVPDEAGSVVRLEKVPPASFVTGFVNLAVVYAIGLLLLVRRHAPVSDIRA